MATVSGTGLSRVQWRVAVDCLSVEVESDNSAPRINKSSSSGQLRRVLTVMHYSKLLFATGEKRLQERLNLLLNKMLSDFCLLGELLLKSTKSTA